VIGELMRPSETRPATPRIQSAESRADARIGRAQCRKIRGPRPRREISRLKAVGRRCIGELNCRRAESGPADAEIDQAESGDRRV